MERSSGFPRISVRRVSPRFASSARTLLVVLAVLLAAVVLMVPGDLSVAQQPGPLVQFPIFQKMRAGRERTGPVEGVFLPADRETALKLERAKDMLSKDQAADAVLELDRILDQREDFFFKPDPNQTVHRSLKAEAQRLIGSLNKDQRAIYELQFGAAARQLLDEATRDGDFQKLSEVVRRYFHTGAGYEAALVLARQHLDHGEPLAAALVLARIKNAPAAAEKYEPNLSLLAATCWLRAGVAEKAKEELAAIKRSFPNAKFELAAKSFSVAGDDADLSALAALVAGGLARSALVTNWTMPGGNPARNAAMEGGSPLLNERWSAGLYYSRSLNHEMARLRNQFNDSGRAAIGCAQPLAVGNLVLMRTPHVVYAVDFETGKLLWPWPPQQASEEQVNAGRDPNYMHLISERTWENNTYGTMTSDGESMFMVHEGDIQEALRGAARARTPRAVINVNGQMVQSPGMSPQNVLSAHSLRREGALEWYLGGLESEMEPQLAGAFFMGPPLPLLGRLYVLAEIKGGISLVVLDAKSGKLEWMQQLAMVEQNVQQDPFRRMSGVTPSFADGVLVCPTAAGAAVAVDLATRSLLWGYQYPRTPDQERMQQQRVAMGWNFNGGMAAPVQPGTHWVDGAAVIAGGRVYLTPVESDQLHCLNLMDGKPLWSKRREGGLYIAAATADQLLVVGEQQVEALSAADGKPLHVTPLGSNRPSGRGFHSGQFYYLPLSSAEVIKIDMATGDIKARARSRTGTIPGNLICYNGYVISQGVDSLDKYFQLEPLRKRVGELLAAKPEDPEALAWRGEIALDDGELARAVADLRKSYEYRPPVDAGSDYLNRLEAERLRTRGLLIDALTASLKEDFAGNKGSLAQLESLIESEQERGLYLRVLAAGLQSEGKAADALASYLQLADLKSGADELEDVEQSRSVQRKRWIGAQLEELWRTTKPEDRATIDQAISARLAAMEKPKEAAPATQEVQPRADRLRDFIATFAFHPLAETAREQLVLQLSEAESPLEREQLLARLEKSADKKQAGAAVARLASLYQSAEREREAAMYYRKLAGEFADVVCLDGKTGKELVAALPPEDKVRRALDATSKWPSGVVRESKKSIAGGRNQGYQQYLNVELRGDVGPFFQGQSVQFDQSMIQLVGRDALGAEAFRVVLNEAGQFRNFGYGYNTNSAVVDGHLMVVNTGFQVLAINTLRADSRSRRVLWHEDLADAAQLNMQQMMGLGGVNPRPAVKNPWGQSRNPGASIGNQPPPTLGPIIEGGVAMLRGRELSFLDALTGKPLWVRHGVPAGSDIYGDSEILIVAPVETARPGSPAAGNAEALVLRTRDGKLLGMRKAPRLDLRWAMHGRNMLTWDPRGRSMRLFLRDVWGGKEIDLGSYTRGSKGTIVGGDCVAIYDAAGKFVIRSLADGSKMFEAAVKPDDQLRNIFVQRSENQYILISNRPRMIPPSSRQENYQPAVADWSQQDNFNNGLVCGRVYAFDRGTGKSQWERPAVIDMHGYVSAQGSELPVLLFLRHTYSNNGQMKVSILCLDKRTGRAVYQNDAIPGQATAFEAVADAEARTVALQFSGNSIQLAFTDEPVKDVAPYQAGTEAPANAGYSGSNMEKLFKVLGEAAGRLNDGAEGAKKADKEKAPQKMKNETKQVIPQEAEKPR